MSGKEQDFEYVPVHILVEHPLEEEFGMPRGRKPGSKNKAAAKKTGDVFVVTMGEGGPGMNRITPDPVGTALTLITPEMPLSNITARKMDKVFTLETRMVPKAEAEQYKLPDIVVLQPAIATDSGPGEEVRGKLTEVISKLNTKQKFYGVGDEVFGFTMQLVEEKSKKSKAGRPRKVKDSIPAETTTVSAAV
jgi:hypothetical protein